VGYRPQTAMSSAVIASQPNLNLYRPGSLVRLTWDHMILLTNKPPVPSHCAIEKAAGIYALRPTGLKID